MAPEMKSKCMKCDAAFGHEDAARIWSTNGRFAWTARGK